jgi:predicted outer membrane lipoprotein
MSENKSTCLNPHNCAGVIKAMYMVFISSGLKDNNNGMQIYLLMMQFNSYNAIWLELTNTMDYKDKTIPYIFMFVHGIFYISKLKYRY